MLTETFKNKITPTADIILREPLKGKTFSILGDSTSTGGKQAWNYSTNFYASKEGIWWQYLIDDLGMKLFRNNSWGGRCLTNINDFDSSRYHKDGTNEGFGGCHIRELRILGDWSGDSGWKNGHLVAWPDFIIIRLGINDFNGGAAGTLGYNNKLTIATEEPRLGDYDGTYPLEEVFPKEYFEIEYDHDFAIAEKTDSLLKDFSKAYAITICRLQRMYPKTKIYCCTMNPFDANSLNNKYPELNNGTIAGENYPGLRQSVVDFNDRIRQLACAFGCGVIEHAQCGITYKNFTQTMYREPDGRYLHQNAEGARLMGQEAVKALAYS